MLLVLSGLFFPLSSPGSVSAAHLSLSAIQKAELQLAEMTPEEKIGQLILVTFNDVDRSDSSMIHELISKYHIGGVVYERSNDNFQDPFNIIEDCWSLSRDLQLIEYDTSDQSTASSSTNQYIPLFIGVSQEGDLSDYSTLISGLSPIPSQMSLGATWNPGLAEQVGSQVGRELSSLGINLLFGPSLDVVSNPSQGQNDLGNRSFGGDPYWVGKFGQAYIKGIHTGSLNNIIVVAKYFPGLGSSDRFPDEEVATVRKSLEQLKQIDLAPFFSVTGNAPDRESTADALLNSHIRYQGLQGNIRATTRPISLDPQAFNLLMSLEPLGRWRDEGGLVISDNISSQAIRQLYDPIGGSLDLGRVAVDAFIAGNDILYLGNPDSNSGALDSHDIISVLEFLTQKYREDADFATRVDTSVTRTLALKNSIYPSFNISTVLTSENTLSAIGNSDISEDVARSSATLVNPDLENLDEVIQVPPTDADRIVILTDTDSAYICNDCAEKGTLGVTDLEDAIIQLYGPFSGKRLVRANLKSYSFKDLTTLLDFPDDVENMVRDVYNASWIIIASLDVSEDRPTSLALQRLLAERQDLLQNKKIILFAYGAPYYLDATNISKINAFFALYNRLPSSLKVSARILFKEFPTFSGSLPVSVPGINYDLISATSPDPNHLIALHIGEYLSEDSIADDPASTPSASIYSVEDVIELHTGLILDHNGHAVPDGTPVTFKLVSQTSVTYLPEVTTYNGRASTSFLVEEGSNITVSAQSSLAKSEEIEINIIGDSSPEANPTPISDQTTPGSDTLEPVATESSSVRNPNIEPQGVTPWRDWAISILFILLIALFAYWSGAGNGYVRWGIRRGLASLIASLSIFNYMLLELPGVKILFKEGFSLFQLVMVVILGGLAGWLTAYLLQRFIKKNS